MTYTAIQSTVHSLMILSPSLPSPHQLQAQTSWPVSTNTHSTLTFNDHYHTHTYHGLGEISVDCLDKLEEPGDLQVEKNGGLIGSEYYRICRRKVRGLGNWEKQVRTV